MENKMIIQKLILTALKEAYVRRAKYEETESRPERPAELDLLEIAIRELTDSIKNEK